MARLDSYQPSVAQLARAGDLRAIAHWLNSCLVPQGIYARVGMAQPGYLRIWVEFQRQPERDRLLRFICHRLCKLNSPVIKGVRISARWVGTRSVLWERSIRIFAPAQRQRQNTRLLPSQSSVARRVPVRQGSRSTSRAAKRIKQIPSLLTSSAVAAFLIGCTFEVLTHDTPASTPEPTETATAVVEPSTRSDTVETALERVRVVQHTALNPDDPTVTLTFSGNATLSSTAESQTSQSDSHVGMRDRWNLAETSAGRQADVAITNLEHPLITSPLQEATDAESTQALTEGNVDVVSLASDRIMESGEAELVQTLDALEQAGIHPIGAGRNQQEARRPEILDVKGQRIAYLGYSDSDLNAARARTAGTNSSPNEQVAADIRAIRDQVDWVIVNYHWNRELAEYPGDWQTDLARFAIDQGADLVVGHHPNVLQGAEIYKGRPIAYSLGNFVFTDRESNPETDYDTAVLKVSLRESQMRLEFLPVQVRQSEPAIAEGEKATEILQYIEQASDLFEQPMQSPMTLDARSHHVLPEAPATAPPESMPTPSDSFITYPDGTYPDPGSEVEEIDSEDFESPKELELEDSVQQFNSSPELEPIDPIQENQEPTTTTPIEPLLIDSIATVEPATLEPTTVEPDAVDSQVASPSSLEDLSQESAGNTPEAEEFSHLSESSEDAELESSPD